MGWNPAQHAPDPARAVQVSKVVIPPPKDGRSRDYAFVEFGDAQVSSHIVESCERGQKPMLDGTPLEVRAARAGIPDAPEV